MDTSRHSHTAYELLEVGQSGGSDLKGHCPVCHRRDYTEPTLKLHLLTNHQGPILVNVVLDLLDSFAKLREMAGPTSSHDPIGCVLCLRRAFAKGAE